MISLLRARQRLSGEYPLALLTSYVAMAAGILSQMVLVPIYLDTLGTEGFGALMLVLGLISYAVVGIVWLNGGLQRVLGEAAGTKDQATFVRALDTGKFIFVCYSMVAALFGIALLMAIGESHVSLLAAILAGLFLVVSYETAVERVALTAEGHQPATNLLQTIQVLTYLASVVVVLHAGGGLPGIFACQIGSVLVSRLLLPLFRATQRPRSRHTTASLRSLLVRFTGPMGRGYFIAGAIGISSQSDVLIVGWLGGAAAAAHFVLVWKIAEVGVQVLWRLPEQLTPILVRLDAKGEVATIRRRYGRTLRLVLVMAIPGGIAYALLGPWITKLWLGANNAPQEPLAFVFAGASIIWLGLMKTPAVLAYALAQTRIWNRLAFIELSARWTLTVVLYPRFGYLSPLVALNIVHICGIALAYQWAGRRLLAGSV